ncbi:SDR family NAD(P)-dependent oxidoreductase [Nocardioides sp. CCNWLW212]|uniref:SDR family NAD(P)-dependent oxidoreductase n=1 Tax=Nocardioides sp. CCNWLW212 TaxID=3128897 RepID=UPI00307D629D
MDRPVALVTGASRGIGRETALVLAREGYDVAFTARTEVEGTGTVPARTAAEGPLVHAVSGSLETTARELSSYGARALPVRMDLHDLGSVRAAAASVLAEWDRIDLLVLNAISHVPHARLLDLDLDALGRSLEANHVHQVALVQAVLPAMAAGGGGTVVAVCSASATIDPPAPPGEGGWGLGYSSAKAAFGRIAGAVNAEYRAAGVRAFNVDPGFVVTESGAARGGTAAIADRGFDSSPADAVGRCAAWLATSADADRFLGKVVWAPRLAESLGPPAEV